MLVVAVETDAIALQLFGSIAFDSGEFRRICAIKFG